MLLDEIGEAKAAERVEGAMAQALTSGRIRSLSTSSGIKTPEYTDVVLDFMG
jgi:hypothetical protein